MQTVNVPCAECGQYHTIQVLCPATAGKFESPPMPPQLCPDAGGYEAKTSPIPDWHRAYCEQKIRADRLDSAFAQADTARSKAECELEREREISCRFQAENQQFERKIQDLEENCERLSQDNQVLNIAIRNERAALSAAHNDIAAANERHEKLRLAYHELEEKAKCEGKDMKLMCNKLRNKEIECQALNSRISELVKVVPESHRAYQVHELQEEVSKLKHENNSLARRINEIRILTQRKA